VSLSPGGSCLSCGSRGLEVVLPHLAGVAVERVERWPGLVCLSVRSRSGEGSCPRCRAVSCRVHSRHTRRLADAAIGGQRVVIRLAVRRFFCEAAAAPSVQSSQSAIAAARRGSPQAYPRGTCQGG